MPRRHERLGFSPGRRYGPPIEIYHARGPNVFVELFNKHRLHMSTAVGVTLLLGLIGLAVVKINEFQYDYAVSQFAQDVRGKLDGQAELLEGEKIAEQIVAVAGGSPSEQTTMKLEGTPINVRNYPGIYAISPGKETRIGTAAQGTVITNALLFQSPELQKWWAFRCNNIQGSLNHPDTKVDIKPQQNSDAICYILAIYGINVTPSLQGNPQ